MSDIEKEIQKMNAKIDMLLQAFGLDGSKSPSLIRQEAKQVLELRRERQALKEKKGRDRIEPCR